MAYVTTETRNVYRADNGCGRTKARLRRSTAYLDAAWYAWRDKYPCECEPDVGWTCAIHRDGPEANALQERRRVLIKRFARWLMWRDGIVCKAKEFAVSYRKVGVTNEYRLGSD